MNVKEENYRKRMYLGQDGNALVNLLVLNAVVFVLLQLVYVFFLATGSAKDSFISHIYNWFVLPANPEKIAWRPWTLISFMFTDQAAVQVYFKYVLALELWVYSAGPHR